MPQRAKARTPNLGLDLRFWTGQNVRMIGDLYVRNAPGIRLFFPARSPRDKEEFTRFWASACSAKLDLEERGHGLCYLQRSMIVRANKVSAAGCGPVGQAHFQFLRETLFSNSIKEVRNNHGWSINFETLGVLRVMGRCWHARGATRPISFATTFDEALSVSRF